MINENQIKADIKKNKLYISEAFMHMTIKHETPSTIIAYEPIEDHKGDLIGWSLMWDVVHQEKISLFTTKPKDIRLIGVYVKRQYRNSSLATLSMNKLLADHKMSNDYDSSKRISHCDTWSGFSELLAIHGFDEDIIKGVLMDID